MFALPFTIPLNDGDSVSISDDGTSVIIDIKGGSARIKNGSSASVSTNAKAIYFITNAANNSVVALSVAADGTLSNGSSTYLSTS